MIFDLEHAASFILNTVLFSFHKKTCAKFSCVCVTSTLIREKNNVLTFFHRKKSKTYHPPKRSMKENT